ncbi:MAG TPA: hypothetical protein VMT19_08755 [Thermoanaerobaculaceae bacterium]|nr:hypothetical protein [Thermoanaerobaculaceae bacterium]
MKLAARVVCLVAVASLLVIVPARAADWRTLGERTLDFRTNPVTIDAVAGAGAVSKLKIEVKQSNLEIGNVKVTFTDGQTFNMDLNKYIGAGGSRVIDLPGAKEVQKVELSYQKYSTAETQRIGVVKLLGSA